MRATELAAFVAVRDAWGGTMYLRPDAVQAISAQQEGETPEVKHPSEPYRVVTLEGGGHVAVASTDRTLLGAFGL